MVSQSGVDTRAVFVVHGRDYVARKAVFEFLRAIDLRPLEWNEVCQQTGSASPYVFEVLACAFEVAQAIVVILTPDEEATLRSTLCTERGDERTRLQPRPNVLFEAGMAFMRDRNRTILLSFGSTDMLSDLHGVHALRVTQGGEIELRHQFASRLQTAGCRVSLQGTDWLSAGDFEGTSSTDIMVEGSGATGGRGSSATSTSRQTDHTASVPPGSAISNTALASGSRSVVVGGDASESIITGGS